MNQPLFSFFPVIEHGAFALELQVDVMPSSINDYELVINCLNIPGYPLSLKDQQQVEDECADEHFPAWLKNNGDERHARLMKSCLNY